MNAARQANVPADQVATILVAGQGRTSIGGSRRPKDLVEAIDRSTVSSAPASLP